MKTLAHAAMLGAASCLLATQALAYTLSGTIPPGGKAVVIDLHKLSEGNITFKFSAPPVSAGVPYKVSFCIGPKDNPCGAPLSHDTEVPAGESRTLTTDALVFSCNELVVGQGTGVTVPYTIEVTQP
jgi:hypothetical protein